ncbi:MAG: alkanesulfonate monooxygenase SsuD [Acidimicrobiales bacterium]|jgi:alkanesulfonate monooxygenase SsuD/methylene tetrahydromethanopterin reductase-like flavin-dependent oxidoreductase (luciferase family)
MNLGLFFMPLHHPDKPWGQAMEEDRQMILHADSLGFAETWMGEHFTSKAEPVPAPLIFLATLINETKTMRFGTGVINLGHRHPMVVAAEVAQFDQLSGGRFMMGVGPGGLASDGEMFGRPDMADRVRVADESLKMIIELLSNDAPVSVQGEAWSASLESQVWPTHGVGMLPKPVQRPHPPIAMAMASPAGDTVRTVAENGYIPISANFVPISAVKGQWDTYTEIREGLGLPVERDRWRVCRNILVTDSDAEAEELLSDPDGTFAFYFRYLAGVRDMPRLASEPHLTSTELFDQLNVAKAIEKCVIAGSAETVTAKLMDMSDILGPFGTLVVVGHDWDDTDRWTRSITSLAQKVAPKLEQHLTAISSR